MNKYNILREIEDLNACKANTDADNFTQTGKSNIITLSNLDYANRISVPGKQSFTAAKSGMFFQGFDAGEHTTNWTLTRNGHVCSLPDWGSYSGDVCQMTIPLLKGDIFYRDTETTGYFYAFIGEE